VSKDDAETLFERWCTPGRPETRPGDTALGDQATRGSLVIAGVQDGLVDEVRTYVWEPAEPAPGNPCAVLVHGWGSRATHFAAVIRALTAAGVRCAAFDAPGHGESGGTTASLPRIVGGLQHHAEWRIVLRMFQRFRQRQKLGAAGRYVGRFRIVGSEPRPGIVFDGAVLGPDNGHFILQSQAASAAPP
jgi:pimeloyl-ACP methyl ester carboxylesterase